MHFRFGLIRMRLLLTAHDHWLSVVRTGGSFNRGEFTLVRTESAISFHGSIQSPVEVVFYQSNINFPRSAVYRSADYSCMFPK